MNGKLRTFLRIFLTLTILVSALSVGNLYAQGSKISGQVLLKSDGSPVIGALVVVVGTTTGTATDMDGNFSLAAPVDSRLKVTYPGYEDAVMQIKGGQTTYVFKITEAVAEIDEVVVVGYGSQRRKEVSAAVARVSAEEISKVSTSDLGTALQGLVAGVTVQSSGGEPGSASQIQIRGLSSIAGSSEPLYVVDGIPYETDPGLSQSEIENIDVLKDAASAAIYGTRGAGGVILITTKKGEKGKMRVNADGYLGTQMISSTVDLVDAAEKQYLLFLDSRLEDNTDDNYASSNVRTYAINGLNDNNLMPLLTNNYALVQNYSVNLSGGSDNLIYSFIGNLYDQEGVTINTGFTRYNIRANSTFKKNDWTITTALSARIEEKQSAGYQVMLESYKYNPLNSAVQLDTTSSGGEGAGSQELDNLSTQVARMKQENYINTEAININFSANYKILQSLDFTSRFGVGFTNTINKQYAPQFDIFDSSGELKTTSSTRSSVRNASSRNTSLTWENILAWKKKYGNHDIALTGVFSVEEYSYTSFFASIKDLTSTDLSTLMSGSADMLVGTGTGSGQDRTNSLVGMLARLQYSYASKYLFSASIRRDGSSRFLEDNRWGYFPSVSAGWNFSEEPFFAPLKKTISAAKLRASLGTTGNQNFRDYAYAATVGNFYDYVYGDENTVASSGVASISYANEDIKWETTQQYNLGLDLAFWKNKFTVAFDMYESRKFDMLFNMSVPPSAGAGSSSTVTRNVGDMRNRGYELAAGYRTKYKNLNLSFNLTAATNDNEITKMPANVTRYYFSDGSPVAGSNTADRVTVIQEGLPAGAFMVLPTNGIVNTEEKLYEYQKIVPNARMGDLIYIDANGDGAIDDNDKYYAGSGAPDYEFGFNMKANFKGFDFSMNWFASLGNEVINGTKIYTYQYQTNKDLLYQWSENNPTSNIPTFRGRLHENASPAADIWVEDGSFLRLKNIMLGYTVPPAKIKKYGLGKLRLYLAADNLITLTPYTGYDPEVGSNGLSKRGLDLGTYPISIQIRGGVQMQF